MSNYLLPYPGLTPQQHWIVLEAVGNAGQSNPILGFRDLAIDWEAKFGLTRADKSKACNQCLHLFHHMGFVEFDETSKTALIKDPAREWYAAIASGDTATADELFREGLARVWFAKFEGQSDWDSAGAEIQEAIPDAEHAAIISALELLEYYGFLGGQPATADLVESEKMEDYRTETVVHQVEDELDNSGYLDGDGQNKDDAYNDENTTTIDETPPHRNHVYAAPDPSTSWQNDSELETQSSDETLSHVDRNEVTPTEDTEEKSSSYDPPPTLSSHPVHEEVKSGTPNLENLFGIPEPLPVGRGRGDYGEADIQPPPRKQSKTTVDHSDMPEPPEVETPSMLGEEEEDARPKGPRAGRKGRDIDSITKAREGGAGAVASSERRSESRGVGSKSSHQIPSDEVEMPRRATSERKRAEVDDDEDTVVRGSGRRKKSRSLEEGDVIDLRDVRRPTAKNVRDDDPLGRVRRKMDDSSTQRGEGRRRRGQGFRNQGPRATPSSAKSMPNDEPEGVSIPIKIDNVMVKVILPPEIAEGLNRMELYDEAYRMVRNILESTQQEDDDETDLDDRD